MCVNSSNCDFFVVQSLSCVWLFVTPMDCSTPGFPVLHYLLEFAQTHVHWVGDTIQSSPLLSHLLLPSVIRSIRVFSSESALHISWPKDWSFSFSSSPSNEYLGLLSFKTDWFEILAVQGTLKSLLQHHSSKASILHHSTFFGNGTRSLEKEMATHSTIFAWRIPWTEESGRLQYMGSQKVGHYWAIIIFSLLYGPTLTSVHEKT